MTQDTIVHKTDGIAISTDRREFLSALYGNAPHDLYVELRCIHPTTANARSFWSKVGDKSSLTTAFKRATALNGEGYGVYFAPCLRQTKSGKADAAALLPTLWVDLDCDDDPKQREAALNKLHDFTPPPSAIIDSGGGLHAYWLLKESIPISWLPTLRAMWSSVGQQIMIPTPRQPYKRYGLGAVNYHMGETVVIFRPRKRRREVAELLQAILDKHPHETVYVAWDNSSTHQDNEVEAVVRGAAGRLVLLYLPTYRPWLNPIEMLWRHFRREVTHCELFDSVKALLMTA